MLFLNWGVLYCELLEEFANKLDAMACVEGDTIEDYIQSVIAELYAIVSGADPLPEDMPPLLNADIVKQQARAMILLKRASKGRGARRHRELLQKLPPEEYSVVHFFEQIMTDSERAHIIRQLEEDLMNHPWALGVFYRLCAGQGRALIIKEMGLTPRQYERTAQRLCRAADEIRKKGRGPGSVS